MVRSIRGKLIVTKSKSVLVELILIKLIKSILTVVKSISHTTVVKLIAANATVVKLIVDYPSIIWWGAIIPLEALNWIIINFN